MDLNEKVELLDVIQLNKSLLGMVELDEKARANADVLKDNKLDGSDSLVILRYLVSLVKELPVTE